MGSIITVTTSRGGAGKTTTTMLLSGNLIALGYRVAVVDADPNQTFSHWLKEHYSGKQPIDLETTADHLKVVEVAQGLAETHDITIVDTAGFGNQAASMAVATSDGVIIPIMSDASSVREAQKTIQLVTQSEKATRRKIPAKALLIAWAPRELVCQHALDEAQRLELPLFDTKLTRSTVYPTMSWTGDVPRSGRPGNEADHLIREMTGLGWLAPKPPTRGVNRSAAA